MNVDGAISLSVDSLSGGSGNYIVFASQNYVENDEIVVG